MNLVNWKLGVSSCSWHNTKEGVLPREMFKKYKEANIDAVEISMPYDLYEFIDYKSTYNNAKEYDVMLWSYHLPFQPFETLDIANKDLTIRKNSVEYLSELIKKASDIGFKIMVAHPSAEPYSDEEREDAIKYSQQSFMKLAEVASRCGSVIAIENLPRTCIGNCISDMKKLISADDRLKVCFDTNHLLKEENIDFIKALGDKIITTHISDYDFLNEKHWLPYEGQNDWVEIVKQLQNCGYSNPFMYEVNLTAPKTIIRDTLKYSDIKDNFDALMNFKKPPILGTPNKKECKLNEYYHKKQF